MRRVFIIIFIFFLTVSFASAQKEGELTASPSVINDSAAPRAILEYNIKLKNNTDHKLNIFPLLKDLQSENKNNTEGLLERQFMMTKWISIKRGSVEIMPESEISLPLKIDISQDAVPGKYFSSITFAYGANRLEAENNALEMSPPKLFISLNVEDQSVEKLSVIKYYPAKKIFTNSKPKINLDLNNSGTVDLIPSGKIFIYNKRNQEVDAIEVNPNLKTVLAGKAFSFEVKTDNNLKTGKYRARLELDYGNKISRDVNDTTYFIVITLPFLLFFGTGIFLFMILLTKLIFKKTYHYHSPKNTHANIKKVSTRKEKKEGGLINLKSK